MVYALAEKAICAVQARERVLVAEVRGVESAQVKVLEAQEEALEGHMRAAQAMREMGAQALSTRDAVAGVQAAALVIQRHQAMKRSGYINTTPEARGDILFEGTTAGIEMEIGKMGSVNDGEIQAASDVSEDTSKRTQSREEAAKSAAAANERGGSTKASGDTDKNPQSNEMDAKSAAAANERAGKHKPTVLFASGDERMTQLRVDKMPPVTPSSMNTTKEDAAVTPAIIVRTGITAPDDAARAVDVVNKTEKMYRFRHQYGYTRSFSLEKIKEITGTYISSLLDVNSAKIIVDIMKKSTDVTSEPVILSKAIVRVAWTEFCKITDADRQRAATDNQFVDKDGNIDEKLALFLREGEDTSNISWRLNNTEI